MHFLPCYLLKRSMWGKGKSSFGHSLFKSLKSTHVLTFSSFLGTGITLATHSAWCMSLMNPTFNCLVTSSLILRAIRSSLFSILLDRYHVVVSINGCWAISASIPSMSSQDHANTLRETLTKASQKRDIWSIPSKVTTMRDLDKSCPSKKRFEYLLRHLFFYTKNKKS